MAEDKPAPKRASLAQADTQSVMGGAVELALKPTHLQVTFARSAQTMTEFEAVRSAVDLTLRMGRMKRVLFDVRVADRSPEEVRAKIWEWVTVSGPFDRAAFLIDNEMLMITINMTGVRSSKAVRAFIDPNQALTWLAK